MIYRTIKRLIPTSAVSISIVVFVITSLIVTHISRNYYDGDFMENVLVEAHGMLFDILVIGVLILFLNKLVEKRLDNRRYRDEIDDFRGWESEEAAYRNAGNLKRLKRNGYKGEIDLSKCYLGGVDLQKDGLLEYIKPYLVNVNFAYGRLNAVKLQGVDLRCANFLEANLKGADLRGANLMGAEFESAILCVTDFRDTNLREVLFQGANLQHATLQGADLRGARLHKARLQHAKLQGTNLRGAIFQSANFQDASLEGADFEEAVLRQAVFERANVENTNLLNADLQNVDLRGVMNLTLDQLSEVKSLYKAKLNTELLEQVKEKYPRLLDEPK